MTWTTFGGVGVVTSQETVVRHPRWGEEKPYPLHDASLLLLEDETEVIVCDVCGEFNGITGREPYVKPDGPYKTLERQANSVLAHVNGVHRRSPLKNGARYSDEEITVLIKIWNKWKGTGIKDWGVRACAELERRGFTPYSTDHWNSDQLGSLVRTYEKDPKFQNVRAAPMTDSDRETLAGMVRESAERAARPGRSTVASNVRITEHKPPTPVTVAKISDKEAAQQPQSKEEAPSVAIRQSASRQTAARPGTVPTLSFKGSGAEPAPTKTLVTEPTQVESVPSEPMVATVKSSTPAPAESASDYVHLLEVDGTPVFTYKGALMAGKPVKGINA